MSSIDVDDESILSSMFKDAFPDSWKNNADFAQYLAELSSYGLHKLTSEPDRLAEERAQILQQTQDLAFHNYKTFIQTADCSRDILKDFQIIESNVQLMLDQFPQLFEECSKFLKTAQDINLNRRTNNVTLQRHPQLLEILELPQLMDTCVRNGYYEEALELAAHARRLERKHASTVPVIANLVNEVKACSQLMLQQLIQQLRSNLQLPSCLRVIGYLRRMDVFTETELRIKFLQARDAWFESVISTIPKEDPYHHITKTIELSRVHLFDIMTQYKAIFTDEEFMAVGKEDGPSDRAIFHGWVVKKVDEFLSTLETDLAAGVGARVDSVLGQAMYFGQSFSRIGADFRGLLAPVFLKSVRNTFYQALKNADHQFEKQMQSFTLLGHSSGIGNTSYSSVKPVSGSLSPPLSLLEIHPLAVYCNSLLTALNELRVCAPLSLAGDVTQALQLSLENAAHVLLAYHKAEESTLNDSEKQRFQHLCGIFRDDLCQYMNQCLQYIYPPQQVAKSLGITVSQLNTMEIVTLDVSQIVLPVKDFIPVKVKDVPSVSVSTPSSIPASQVNTPPVTEATTAPASIPTSVATSLPANTDSSPKTDINNSNSALTTDTQPETVSGEEKTFVENTKTLSDLQLGDNGNPDATSEAAGAQTEASDEPFLSRE